MTAPIRSVRILIAILVLLPVIIGADVFVSWNVQIERARGIALSSYDLKRIKRQILERAEQADSQSLHEILFAEISTWAQIDWDLVCFFPAYTDRNDLEFANSGMKEVFRPFEHYYWRVGFFRNEKWLVTFRIRMGDKYYYGGAEKVFCKRKTSASHREK